MKKYPFLEPQAKRAVDDAKGHDTIIMMMVDGYQTIEEAMILKDFLWYARDNWVTIQFIPNAK